MNQKELKEDSITESEENNDNDKINEKTNELTVEVNESSKMSGNDESVSVETGLCESINKPEENSFSDIKRMLEEGKRKNISEVNIKFVSNESSNTPCSSLKRDSDVTTARIKLGQEDNMSLVGADWSLLYSRLNALTSSSIPTTCSAGELPCNSALNRYTNILPNDTTRVVLSGHAHTDYVNANYVQVKRAGRRYVMTQGPLSHTCEQFWHMAWQVRSPGVVMLNRVLERNNEKCYPYYPSSQDDCLKFGHFKITCESIEDRSDYIVSKLRLENLVMHGDSNPRFLTHFQHKTWPDFGVPVSRRAFLAFLYSVRATGMLDDVRTPPIIHCSAGVGRSGTFVLIDSCLRMAELELDGSDIDIEEVIGEMRVQRFGCIQSREQLKFSYRCVVYAVKYRSRVEGNKQEIGNCGEVKSKRPLEEPIHDSDRGVKRQKQVEDELKQ